VCDADVMCGTSRRDACCSLPAGTSQTTARRLC
jgi:hypothetical protein